MRTDVIAVGQALSPANPTFFTKDVLFNRSADPRKAVKVTRGHETDAA